MANESTIRYELLTTAGLRTVAGDHVKIPNEVGATFGIHADPYLADGHPAKWTVTHLASGMAAGRGSSRTAAADAATANVRHNRKRLREMLDEAMSARAELQLALRLLERNQMDITGGTPK